MRRLLAAFLLLSAVPAVSDAQQLAPPSTGGIVALDRMLGHLASNRRLLVIAAHPDDENNELLTLASRGHGVDVAYFSLSRGEGGQNLIGNELGEALGLIRTGELLAARSIDGGHQFFSRNFDFGFSKSLAETDRFWPRDTSLADLLRVIRRFRPQVLVAVFSGTPRDGHGQHQQSSVVAQQAFALLRDSAWGPKKLYRSALFDTSMTTLRLPSGLIDPAEGKSYVQLSMLSRSQHRSQDMGQIQRVGPGLMRVALLESLVNPRARSEASLFEGVDTTLPAGALRYAALVDSARAALGPGSLPRVRGYLVRALQELRRADTPWYLRAKEAELSDAILTASGIVVDPYADDQAVIPGQTFNVMLLAYDGRGAPLRVTAAAIETPPGWSVRPAPLAQGQGTAIAPTQAPGASFDPRRFQVTVAADAVPDEPYFVVRPRIGARYDWSGTPDSLRGEAFDPPLLTARVTLDIDGVAVTVRREVSWRFQDQAQGEVRKPVSITPLVGVTAMPDLLVWPVEGGVSREVTVELVNGARATTAGEVSLELPAGWPAVAAQRFTLEGEGTRHSLNFPVRAPARLPAGAYEIHAVATVDGRRYDRAVVTIDYPHIRPTRYTTGASVRVQAVPLSLPALRQVGYVRGASDVVPEALRAVGVPVRTLSADDLERADLSQFDAIVIGPRAYEVDAGLVANNGRLLDYARAGGRVIVQYQQFQFIRGNFAPFPLTMANPHDRVTDETAPVRALVPGHPLLAAPNVLGPDDWNGWVQERGLYFAHSWDDAYRPLLEMGDPPVTAAANASAAAQLEARGGTNGLVPNRPGEGARDALRGGLLVAHLGRGLYVYTGLSFFRQLPAGVPGAYRLFLNLLGMEPSNVP